MRKEDMLFTLVEEMLQLTEKADAAARISSDGERTGEWNEAYIEYRTNLARADQVKQTAKLLGFTSVEISKMRMTQMRMTKGAI